MVAAMEICTNKTTMATTKKRAKRSTILYLSPELIRSFHEAADLIYYLDCKKRASAPNCMKITAMF